MAGTGSSSMGPRWGTDPTTYSTIRGHSTTGLHLAAHYTSTSSPSFLFFEPVLHNWCNRGMVCTSPSFLFFEPVLHNWCNRGMVRTIITMLSVHINGTLLLIGKLNCFRIFGLSKLPHSFFFLLPRDPRLREPVFGLVVGVPEPSVDMDMSIVAPPPHLPNWKE